MNTPFETSGADLHGASGRAVAYDPGLRRYMLGIYRTMALGLVLTGLVAFLVAGRPADLAADVAADQAQRVRARQRVHGAASTFSSRVSSHSRVRSMPANSVISSISAAYA